MAYYEDDILHELQIDESYTQKQLAIFVVENKDVVVISKTCNQFMHWSTNKHRVVQILDGYEHKSDNNRTYHIPNSISKFYILD